jgi:hypothetical protein
MALRLETISSQLTQLLGFGAFLEKTATTADSASDKLNATVNRLLSVAENVETSFTSARVGIADVSAAAAQTVEAASKLWVAIGKQPSIKRERQGGSP